MDTYAWFKGMVQDRRKLAGEGLDKVADGRVFTGRQAIALKLIDEIGDEQTAIDWLAKEKQIDAEAAGARLAADLAAAATCRSCISPPRRRSMRSA